MASRVLNGNWLKASLIMSNCVKHVSRLCIINHYSSRVYAADFTLRFDKKPTSPANHTNGSAVAAVDAWLLKPPAGFVQCLVMMWRPAILAIPAHSLLSFLHAQLAKL